MRPYEHSCAGNKMLLYWDDPSPSAGYHADPTLIVLLFKSCYVTNILLYSYEIYIQEKSIS